MCLRGVEKEKKNMRRELGGELRKERGRRNEG